MKSRKIGTKKSIVAILRDMSRRLVAFIFVAAGLSLSLLYHTQSLNLKTQASTTNKNFEIWVQESNGGQGGSVLPDFKDMFLYPDKWARARQYVDVFQFHQHVFLKSTSGATDEFISAHIVPVLAESNIKVSLNVVGANWSQCGANAEQMFKEGDLVAKLRGLGMNVAYLEMQSTVSKSDLPDVCEPYSDEQRIEDIVRYVSYMKQRFPDIKIGVTDADAVKGNDYRTKLSNVVSAVRAAGYEFDFIFLDNVSAGILRRQRTAEIIEFERFVRQELRVVYGAIYTGEKSTLTSNADFRDDVLVAYRLHQQAGAKPRYLQVTSWMIYPTQHIPDNDKVNFPLMKVLFDFGRRVYQDRGVPLPSLTTEI